MTVLNFVPRPQEKPDTLIHFTLMDGMVRGILLNATQTVSEAARIHETTPVVTAALGRTLMGTAMLASMLKDEKSSVTVTVDGGGPVGRIVCVGEKGAVRGMADHPQVQLPLRPDGKLNVGLCVGHEGRMSVVKDLGMRTPFVGQTALVSGEIAEDFAAYYVQSEQSPTLQSLGVLVGGNTVLSAGGVLLQPLPGCDDGTLDQLEMRSPLMADISRELCYEEIESLAGRWFDGLRFVPLEREPLQYRCSCSRERMERALISLGREELTRMIEDEQDGAELCCHFCRKAEHFSQAELRVLLMQAQRKEDGTNAERH